MSCVSSKVKKHFFCLFLELNLLFLSNSLLAYFFFTFPLFHRVKSRLCMESTSTPLPGLLTHNHHSPAHTPTHLNLGDWSSSNLVLTPSSIHSNGSCHTLTPSASPIHAELCADSMNESSTHSQRSSIKSSQRRSRNWVRTEEALPRPNFEPKNLLSLFEETTLEGLP